MSGNYFRAKINTITYGNGEQFSLISKFDPLTEIVSASNEILVDVFKKLPLRLSDNECLELIELLRKYYSNRTIKLYENLPKRLAHHVDNFILSRKEFKGLDKESVASSILISIINNSAYDVSMEKIKYVAKQHRTRMLNMSDENFQQVFEKIDQIREENPEIAEQVLSIKEAFDKAKSFNIQLEYLKNDSLRNVKRYKQHFIGDISWYNKWVNQTDIPIPIIDPIMSIIQAKFKNRFTTDEYKSFVVLLIRSVKDLQINRLNNLAYVHKLTDSILRLRYKFISSEDERIFSGIEKVLLAIREKLNNNSK